MFLNFFLKMKGLPVTPLSEHLKSVRTLIGSNDKWTTRSYARDKYGTPCHDSSSFACTFCSVGAIKRYTKDLYPGYRESSLLETEILQSFMAAGYGALIILNDLSNHSSLMLIWDKVIEAQIELENNSKL